MLLQASQTSRTTAGALLRRISRSTAEKVGWCPGVRWSSSKTGGVKFSANDASTGAITGEFQEFGADHTINLAYCARYTTGGNFAAGPTVTDVGTNGRTLCNTTLPVACSAPVAIPVAP